MLQNKGRTPIFTREAPAACPAGHKPVAELQVPFGDVTDARKTLVGNWHDWCRSIPRR